MKGYIQRGIVTSEIPKRIQRGEAELDNIPKPLGEAELFTCEGVSRSRFV